MPQNGFMDSKRTTKYTRRLGQLDLEREDFIKHWEDITDYILPRSGRYFLEDRNDGMRRNLKIYDSTATRALNVLAAGMMAGMSSPARRHRSPAAGPCPCRELPRG